MARQPRGVPPHHGTRPPAASGLAPGHPLARAAAWRSALAGQLGANSALLILAGVLSRRSDGWRAVLSIALVVELLLVCGLALATMVVGERARNAIADGIDTVGLADVREIAAEVARLSTPHARARISDALARALHDAEHWSELSVCSRPPPAVRNLLDHGAAAREIIRLAREPEAPLRALALLDRMLREGYSGIVYAGPSDALGRELGRVRYLLAEAVDVQPALRPFAAGSARSTIGSPS